MSDCLKILKANQFIIHPAFEQALLKLYGYTSDAKGIRHALSENDDKIFYSEAKFMLVSCSAFINFLMTKIAELKTKV